jgi:hypothetical protein
MKKRNMKFFDYEVNQRDLIIALFVVLILVGLDLIKFILTSFLQFLKFPSINITSIILILPIPLLLWLIAVNGRSLPGFKDTNLSNNLKYYSKILFMIILIQIILILLLKTILLIFK